MTNGIVEVPKPLSNSERKARYRANNPGRPMTHAKYLGHPFIAWDGEGYDEHSGNHVYNMLCNSMAGSLVSESGGLSTSTILSYVWEQCSSAPDDAIHVVYGASYDWNMWLKDLSRRELQQIYERPYVELYGFRIQWRRGKSFWIKPIGYESKGAMIYDVVSFFQCSFVKACDSYLGDREEWQALRSMVVENKALRGQFTQDSVESVLAYNRAELDLLVLLMNELRLRLDKAGLRPARWDGPGAIAAALLSSKRTKTMMRETPDEIGLAVRTAYAGGRFEVLRFGVSPEPVWEYDINSAYPAALMHVPDLAHGHWRHTSEPTYPGPDTFALYRVRWESDNPLLPQPFFCRAPKGSILYPCGPFEGWYWGPDVWAAQFYPDAHTLTILEAWEYLPDSPSVRPFGWVEGMYNKRRALKKAKDGAHVGYKLALNSLYGKTAQQVGAKPLRGGGWKLPPFHQLEWAGFVTAWCRSRVYSAAMQSPFSVVAFETDALFTTKPLDLRIGSDLGAWEETTFSSLSYFQSGVYFGTGPDGEVVARTRGVNLGSLSRNDVETSYADSCQHITASLTSFITAGLALQGRFRQWRRWITADRTITLHPTGKREAINGNDPTLADAQGWQATHVPYVPDGYVSAEFPVAWVNPNPVMSELEERREASAERDYETEG